MASSLSVQSSETLTPGGMPRPAPPRAPNAAWCPESLPYVAKPRSSSDGPCAPGPPPVKLGMMPFIPPPPSCAARRDHDAGSTTLKLIGLAVLAVSIGAIDPFRRQCAGAPFADSTHDGADSVTLRTGSPIADGATDDPSRSAVQSAAVMVFPTAFATVAVATGLAWSVGGGVAARNGTVATTSTASGASTPGISRNICLFLSSCAC